MKNSTTIKILIGLALSLFIIAGIVWFFASQQHQKGQENISQEAEAQVEEPTKGSDKEASGEEPAGEESVAPIPTPVPFDASRIADPMQEFMTPSDLANELGITKENYPRIDGSTSTFELSQGIYWEMFWPVVDWGDYPEDMGAPKAPAKTIPSYKYLIAGDVDLIVVPDPSQEVRDLEKEAGVELEYIPIGVEGLIFITPEGNPVSNITVEQVNQIYADITITNWSQLGGRNGEILALCRNDDSGSQAQFDNLVMGEGKEINPILKEKYALDDMQMMISAVSGEEPLWIDGEPVELDDNFPLGYSIYYYLQGFGDSEVVRGIKTLSVDGVVPTADTIATREYPLAMSYFAVIRKSTPQDAPARIIANWLTTPEGQDAVYRAGLGKNFEIKSTS